MSDQDDVRRIALSLPGAVEEKTGYRVNGRLFVWTYPERVAPKKPRVPNPAVLAVLVGGEDEKQALLNSDPVKFFTVEHYDGYPTVLVRLVEVDAVELRELITEAWRIRSHMPAKGSH